MSSDVIAVDINLTSADASAVRRNYFKRRWLEFLLLILPLPLYLLYAFFLQEPAAIALYRQGWEYDLAEQVTVWGAIIAFFTMIILVCRRLVRIRQRRSLAFQGYRVAISQDGVVMTRDGMRSEMAWRVLHEVRRAGTRTFIYIDPQTAYVIPSRSFASEENFETFNQSALAYFNAAHPGAA